MNTQYQEKKGGQQQSTSTPNKQNPAPGKEETGQGRKNSPDVKGHDEDEPEIEQPEKELPDEEEGQEEVEHPSRKPEIKQPKSR